MGGSRFIFYSHDGLGLGHLRRNLAIASALTRADHDASVLLVTGCIDLGARWLAPNVDIVAIPALRKLGNGRYGARRLPVSATEIRAMRAAQVSAIVESFQPGVLLIDKHPMGVRGELRPALESLRRCGGKAVLGLRDILDDPATVRAEWDHERVIPFVERRCDRLLVYGDAAAFDFAGEYGLPPALAARMRHCGYVVADEPAAFARPRPAGAPPKVLACAGGGEDGRALLEAFVAAARGARWDAVVVAGPQSGTADREALRRMSRDAGVAFRESLPELSARMPEFDALVCMGGYNTLGEALSRGMPTVCVPRVHPRTEQLIRARLFAGLGLLRVVEPWRLEPALMRDEVTAALATDRRALAARARATLSFDGARLAAQELLELVREPVGPRRRVRATRYRPTARAAKTAPPALHAL